MPSSCPIASSLLVFPGAAFAAIRIHTIRYDMSSRADGTVGEGSEGQARPAGARERRGRRGLNSRFEAHI
jgi:hypothetical protein